MTDYENSPIVKQLNRCFPLKTYLVHCIDEDCYLGMKDVNQLDLLCCYSSLKLAFDCARKQLPGVSNTIVIETDFEEALSICKNNPSLYGVVLADNFPSENYPNILTQYIR